MIVIEGVNAAGMAPATTSKICSTIFNAFSKPLYLKMESTTHNFSLEKGYFLPICSSLTMMNLRSSGMAKPALFAMRFAEIAIVSGVRCPHRPKKPPAIFPFHHRRPGTRLLNELIQKAIVEGCLDK